MLCRGTFFVCKGFRMNLIKQLAQKNLIAPPSYVSDGLQYLALIGSQAYGVANTNDKDEVSDWDIYGFCIPNKDMVFPHLKGEITGFGRQIKRFEQYQQHHIKDVSTNREYDLSIYSIVKYFNLAMQCNPNMIDSLFTPRRCVLYSSPISELIRENRKLFLHKGSWHKFRGYAYQQMHKMKDKNLKLLTNALDKHSLPDSLTLEDVENEMKRRNLL